METPQDSMTEQLCELYAEKEILESHFPGMSVAKIIEVVKSVHDQLAAIEGETFESLADTSDRKEQTYAHLPITEVTDSVEAQLIELYAERQALAEAFPGKEIVDIAEDFKHALEQIERFYRSVERPLANAA